jgi:hypothetical protein
MTLRSAALRDVVIVSCAISAGMHAALAPAHLAESAALGIGFVLAAGVLAVLAAVVTRDSDGTRSVAIAALTLAGLVASYALAATTGLPGVVSDPEQVDGVAIACKAAEWVGLAAASALLWRARPPVALTLPSTKGQAT